MDPKVTTTKQSGIGTAAIVTLIVGLIVGFGVTSLVESSHYNSQKKAYEASAAIPDAGTKAADLRADLVSLGVQHMDLTDQAIDAALDGSPNAAAAKADLIANGTAISAAVGSIYGSAAQNQFQTLWNNHLTDFINYAVASKSGDSAGKTAALNDIQTNYTLPISKLLSGANPNLPYATLVTEFGDHVTMTAQMIDDHVSGNYTAEATMRQQGDAHLEGLMSTLAGAIVKQYPSKF
jgi:hypothetical protein